MQTSHREGLRRKEKVCHLADDKGEQQVDEGGYALSGRPGLQKLHFCSVEPGQRPPRPRVRADVEAHEEQCYPRRHWLRPCQHQRRPNAHLATKPNLTLMGGIPKHNCIPQNNCGRVYPQSTSHLIPQLHISAIGWGLCAHCAI